MKVRLAMVAALLAVGGVAAGALALWTGGDEPLTRPSPGPYRGSEPPGRIPLAGFGLRDTITGELVRARDLRGRVVLLTFLDSQCTESCPVIAFQVARGLDLLSRDERLQVEAIAISTDPEEDTPANIRAFLRKQHALGRFRYVNGAVPEMRRVWKRFHILSSLESGKDTLHSAPVRVYDREGIWVSTLHPGVDLTQANLVHDIRVALIA